MPPKVREEERVEDGAIPARGAILVVYNCEEASGVISSRRRTGCELVKRTNRV